jgi:hypothetical protein
MAQNITLGGSVSLTPAPSQVTLPGSYISSFDFLNQYLPDVAEKEFERYGNRSVSSFLRMVGAEMPCNSDLIKWSEQGRLHIKYEAVVLEDSEVATNDSVVIEIPNHVLRKGQTVMVSDGGSGATASFKGIITAVVSGASGTITVAIYDADGLPAVSGLSSGDNSGTNLDVFVYGSEFKKGSNGIEGSLEAPTDIKSNNPIIIKDKYSVSGSDMAQIGWIEVTTENGASGYLWYLKSEHETRLRFEDYLETAMVEAVPAETGSGAVAASGDLGNKGSEGLFYAIENGGNTSTGAIQSLDDIDAIVGRLDKQGSIEENVIFVNRGLSFEIDNVLAELNGFDTSGGAANAASFGLFDNDTDMALNLGFSGFRRGYDFYKSDWKYLNDATMRGGITGGAIDGVLVPAGSTTVYDQVLGKNAKRPFLHVRYKASQTEDRKMKSWIVGSAGGASNSDLDAMEVHFLSERALCTLGANNFFLFK